MKSAPGSLSTPAATAMVSALLLGLTAVLSRRTLRLIRYAAPLLFFFMGSALAWASFSLTFQGAGQVVDTGSIALNSPSAVAVDSAGNLYIADTANSQIVRVNPQGVASVLAISGLSPALSSPAGITVDGAGNLYIADTGNNRVVQVSALGDGSVISMGSVTLSSPKGVAVDSVGDIFVADTGNSRIVEVTSGGSAAVFTITGLGTALNTPKGLAFDTKGKLYIADSVNNRIVTVAAGGTAGAVVSITGGVTLSAPSSVAVDGLGNIFIADTSHDRIATVDIAGNGGVVHNNSVIQDAPQGVAVDVFGNVVIADTGSSRALMMSPTVNADITAGDPDYSVNKSQVGFGHIQLGSSTGKILALPFTIPFAPVLGAVKVFTSGTENLDFTMLTPDPGSGPPNCAAGAQIELCVVNIQFLPTAPGLRTGAVVLYDDATPANVILTIPLYGFSDAPLAALSPNNATVISSGAVITQLPFQLALDGSGNMYVGNYVQSGGNPKVVKIPTGGGSASVVSTGSVTLGSSITGIALDGAGNLFIADYYQQRIVVVTPGGVVSVLSISGLSPTLGQPTELAFDAAGNLYIADYSPNSRIVEVSSLSVAGSTSSGLGRVIGTGSFTFPSSTITGVAVGPNGNVYIAGRTSNTSHVVQVTAAGVASLLNPAGLTFSNPQGAFVDGMGNLYVEDSGNARIVRITTAGVASAIPIQGLSSPTTLAPGFGVTVDPLGNFFIPDWTNSRILSVSVSAATMRFASTNRGSTSSDSPKTTTVTNLGDLPLLFSGAPTFTANFPQPDGSDNQCLSSTSLASGTVCGVSVAFTPQAAGVLTAGFSVTNNTLNVDGSTQAIVVGGTGISTGDSTSVSVSTSPASLTVGQPITVTAIVGDTASGNTATVPTGNVTFLDTLGSTVVSLNDGSPVALVDGSAALAGVTLSGAGVHTITATYAGVSGAFLTSTNTTTVTVAAAAQDFSLNVVSGGTTSATVAPGGTATYSLVIQPTSGTTFPTAVTLSVTGLPPGATATITPAILAAGSATTNLSLQVRVPSQIAAIPRHQFLPLQTSPLMIGMLLLPFAGKIRRAARKHRTFALVLLLALSGASLTLMTGCGSKDSGFLGKSPTSYTLTVTGTSGALSHSTTLKLTVQ